MVSIMEIMQLCRLCLVKEQVNIPIFEDQGDIRQIFFKITACLPVKISKEDKLPKKICDGCLYKLELLYQFWNTTANAEKQLLSWIEQTNMDVNSKSVVEPLPQSQPQLHTVKQEKIEPAESTNESVDLSTDTQSYILQQQQLPYQTDYQFKESQGSNVDGMDTSENSDEPLSKRRRRRQATKPIPPESLDSSENEGGDSLLEMAVTKTEEESESEGEENIDDPEPTKLEAVGTEDSEQPGPSGLGKGGTEAPKRHKRTHRKNVNMLRYNFSYNQPEGIYSCNNCIVKSKSQDEMEEHVKEHEAYVCSVCDSEFYSLYKFSVHMETHDPGTFKCPLCDYQTFRKTAILRHINTNHLNKFIYNCTICGKGFEDAENFRDHQNGHAGAKAYSCVVCKKEFPFNRYLLAHQKRSHMVTIEGVLLPNQCSVCKRVLSRPSNLEKHMIQHDAAFLQATHHLCDICGKGFARKDKLRLHYRMHTGIKPYKCSYCTKSFAKREYLIMHERIHSGEKPFACQYCGKAFNQRTSLKTHIRGHTGERPYVCHICKTGFISKNSLNLHFKTCNG